MLTANLILSELKHPYSDKLSKIKIESNWLRVIIYAETMIILKILDTAVSEFNIKLSRKNIILFKRLPRWNPFHRIKTLTSARLLEQQENEMITFRWIININHYFFGKT